MEMQKCSFVIAVNKFFGRRPTQDLKSFKAEIDALTPKDRADLSEMFKTVGYEIVEEAK